MTMDQMADLVDSIIDRANDESIGPLTDLIEAGEIDADTWQDTFAQIIKDTFLILALIALGGILTTDFLNRLEERIRIQYGFLENFAQEIMLGQLTWPEVLRRSHMYINSTRQAYWMVLDEEFGNSDYTKERWLSIGDSNVCSSCDEADMAGWQPLGTFGEPGSGVVFRDPTTMCLGLTSCRCRKDYR